MTKVLLKTLKIVLINLALLAVLTPLIFLGVLLVASVGALILWYWGWWITLPLLLWCGIGMIHEAYKQAKKEV